MASKKETTHPIKKFFSIMLGLSLLIGSGALVVVAQETPKEGTEGKKKGKKKKKEGDPGTEKKPASN